MYRRSSTQNMSKHTVHSKATGGHNGGSFLLSCRSHRVNRNQCCISLPSGIDHVEPYTYYTYIVLNVWYFGWFPACSHQYIAVKCMLNTTTLAIAMPCESELARSTFSLRMPHEVISAHCMLLRLQSCPSPLQYCSSSFHSHLPMHTPGGISRQFIQK